MRILKNDALAEIMVSLSFHGGSPNMRFRLDINEVQQGEEVDLDCADDVQITSLETTVNWDSLKFSGGQNCLTVTLLQGLGPFVLNRCEMFIEQDPNKTFEVMIEP